MIRLRDYKLVRVDGQYEVRITANRKRLVIPLSMGGDDRLCVFREGDELIFMNTHWRLGYCGIEVYSLKYGAMLESMFLQGDQVNETLGKRGMDCSDLGLVRKLYHHWSECFC